MRKILLKTTAILLLAVFFCAVEPLAVEAKTNLTIICEGVVYRFSEPQISTVLKEKRLNDLRSVIKKIAKNHNRTPKDAQIIFSPQLHNKFSFIKEECGKKLDENKLKEDILNALSVGGGGVNAEFITLQPKILKSELEKLTYLRSKFTTSFYGSCQERIDNIALAANLISGTVLDSGEEFSFNKRVGTRSIERGFKTAKVILNGMFTEGVGGGVCQVSTTLYNAALIGGMKITEQHSHSLAVSYVEKSFDAMVSSDFADLKFINDTAGKVFIAAFVKGATITVEIYGYKPDIQYLRRSELLETMLPKERAIVNPNLLKGETKRICEPKNGYRSKGYLLSYKNGAFIGEKQIREDCYLSMDGITEVSE